MRLGPKVTIVSAWVGPNPRWLGSVQENHQRFASKFGYQYIMLRDEHFPDFKPAQFKTFDDYSWLKVDAIRYALAESDFAFWIDADSVFMQPFKDLSAILPFKQDLAFTGDRNDLLNAGHLIFRNSEFSWQLLEEWEALKHLPFPPLNTTMQSFNGFVSDQVALNYLIAGGIAEPASIKENGATLFNRVNGWKKNPDRVHKAFDARIAPVSRLNLVSATKLIPKKNRRNFKIVQQHRLNAYPWWGKASGSKNRPGPIVHFVGPWKEMLENFPDDTPRWN